MTYKRTIFKIATKDNNLGTGLLTSNAAMHNTGDTHSHNLGMSTEYGEAFTKVFFCIP